MPNHTQHPAHNACGPHAGRHNSTASRLRGVLIVLLGMTAVPALADAPAVTSSNYELNFHSSDTYASSTRLSYYYAYAGRATFPLGKYLGTSLTAEYADTTVIATPATDISNATGWEGCGYRGNNYGIDLFARAPHYGRLGIAYLSNQLKSSCQATFITNNSDRLNTDTYSAYAEYYFSRVTLAAAYASTSIPNASDITSDTLTVSWYPTDLFRLTVAASGMDLQNTYSVELAYQPPFLDDKFSVHFRYTTQKQSITTQSFLISVSYYFNVDVDLITRDRNYR